MEKSLRKNPEHLPSKHQAFQKEIPNEWGEGAVKQMTQENSLEPRHKFTQCQLLNA